MTLSAPLLLAVIAAQAAPAPDLKDETYGPHERNVFDLWKAKSDKPAPLVLFIHGGGFRAGRKEQVSAALVKACLEAGISVAAINYRLSQHAPFPAPMHDAALCVQTLRHRAKELNLDPARFASTGSSAGGGISLWLAFHDDLADPKSEDPVKRESTRLLTVAGMATQCSYDPRFIKKHIGGLAWQHPALPPFYGLKEDELETEKAFKLYEEASPITHLTKDDPPVYLVYGGNDEPDDVHPGKGVHSSKFGAVLQEAMKKLKIDCEVKVGGRDEPAIKFLISKLKN